MNLSCSSSWWKTSCVVFDALFHPNSFPLTVALYLMKSNRAPLRACKSARPEGDGDSGLMEARLVAA
jgi:hypothetical protein